MWHLILAFFFLKRLGGLFAFLGSFVRHVLEAVARRVAFSPQNAKNAPCEGSPMMASLSCSARVPARSCASQNSNRTLKHAFRVAFEPGLRQSKQLECSFLSRSEHLHCTTQALVRKGTGHGWLHPVLIFCGLVTIAQEIAVGTPVGTTPASRAAALTMCL